MDIADPERTRSAWRSFVETGVLPVADLRPHVYRAWSRCREQGVDPRAAQARVLSGRELSILLEDRRDLIDAASPYLRALSLAAGGERHAAMLGDPTGVVLDIVADEETAHFTQGFPGPGALLSEAVAGANGIGTPLAENAYVELVGPEHFIEGFHAYTCQGLPLLDSGGAATGVLGMSVRRVKAAERLHEILVCAARGIEAELTHRHLTRSVVDLAGSSDHEHLEALRQDVVQVHAAARLHLEGAARTAGSDRGDASAVLARARALIQRFQRQAAIWREIAHAEVGPPRPLDLRGRAVELAEMLATEAAVHGRAIEVRPGEAEVLADPRVVSRALLRGVLRALRTGDGTVAVGIRAREGTAWVEVGDEPVTPRLALQHETARGAE